MPIPDNRPTDDTLATCIFHPHRRHLQATRRPCQFALCCCWSARSSFYRQKMKLPQQLKSTAMTAKAKTTEQTFSSLMSSASVEMTMRWELAVSNKEKCNFTYIRKRRTTSSCRWRRWKCWWVLRWQCGHFVHSTLGKLLHWVDVDVHRCDRLYEFAHLTIVYLVDWLFMLLLVAFTSLAEFATMQELIWDRKKL